MPSLVAEWIFPFRDRINAEAEETLHGYAGEAEIFSAGTVPPMGLYLPLPQVRARRVQLCQGSDIMRVCG